MNDSPAGGGLYALKPWYARRLAGLRAELVRRNVTPNALTVAGVACGAAAGVALAVLPVGIAALAVAPLLAARLAFANFDGGVARDSGRSTRWGSVVNELGDRAAELAVLAGCFALAPSPLVLAAALAASAPSWVSLAGAAAGGDRVQGGPVGKTERALLLVLIAATGAVVPLLVVLAAGSALTACFRLRKLHVSLCARALDNRTLDARALDNRTLDNRTLDNRALGDPTFGDHPLVRAAR